MKHSKKLTRPIRIAATGAAIASAGLFLVAPSGAAGATSTTTTPNPRVTQAQQKLEQQLNARVTQLRNLSTDVTKATGLTASDASTLAARLTSATTSIDNLLAQVPSDTTMAKIRVANRTMIDDNRVFAVLTPQVFEVVEADTIAGEVTSMQAGEAALQSDVDSLQGQSGYANALKHDTAYVTAVNRAAAESAHVSATVMAQLPQDFPRDTHVFVSANRQLLAADVTLAHATYDASVIGLASGGYTGS